MQISDTTSSSRPIEGRDDVGESRETPDRSDATLPYAWYSDPAILALEEELIFRCSWQLVGRLEESASW